MEFVNLSNLLAALIYSVAGAVIFIVVFALVDLISPRDLWGEITEKQNLAMAVLAGCVAIGLCIIIAASIIG